MKIDDLNDLKNDYVVIKANSDQVSIMGLTRGEETKSHHTEKLQKGEVLVAEFTHKTSAIKIKGNATIYTKYGVVESESD